MKYIIYMVLITFTVLVLPFPAYCEQQLIEEKISSVSEVAIISGMLRLPRTPGPCPAIVGEFGSCRAASGIFCPAAVHYTRKGVAFSGV